MSIAPRLIVRLHNWIGDVIVGLPVLQLLESRGVAFEAVGRPWAASLLAGHGWTIHTRPDALRERVRQMRALGRRLSPERLRVDGRPIDALLLATAFSAALDARLGGLRAMGYDTDHRRWLLARSLPRPHPDEGHNLEEHWKLGCALLGLSLPAPREIGLKIAPADQAAADERLRERGIGGRFVMLCPFATGRSSGQSKVWPQFRAFADALRAQGVAVAICPGPGETEWAQRDYPDLVDLGPVKIGQFAGLLRRAAVVVANDTGPGHMTAAIGAPLVSVFGPGSTQRWRPWGPNVTIVQGADGGWPTLDAVLERSSSHIFR